MTAAGHARRVPAAAFSHHVDRSVGRPTVRLHGELDITTIGSMQAALRALRNDADPIVVDLSGLEFAGVRGTRSLAAEIAALRTVRPVAIVNLPARVRRVATLLRVAHHLDVRSRAL